MKNVKKSYLLGILGAIIGAIIGTIPWVLVYVYANIIYAILAIIIAVCALKGYELFHGKVDRSLPYIIGFISLLSITIATFIIIPCVMLVKENLNITIANYELFFNNSDILRALISDYVISLLFTFLGIFSILKTIKTQVSLGEEKINLKYEDKLISNEELEKIKNVFTNHNALSKKYTISKEMVLNETGITEDELSYLIKNRYIKAYKGNFYYLGKKNNKKLNIIIITISIIIILLAIFINSTNDNNEYNNKDVNYTVSDEYQEYVNEYEDNSWYYVPKSDVSGNSGVVIVTIDEDEEFTKDLDDARKSLDDVLESNYNIIDKDEYTNKNNCKIFFYTLDRDDYKEYIYYVFSGSKFASVDGLEYSDKYNVRDVTKKIADTFKWQ